MQEFSALRDICRRDELGGFPESVESANACSATRGDRILSLAGDLYVAGCESSPATRVRAAANQSKRQHFRDAYGVWKFHTQRLAHPRPPRVISPMTGSALESAMFGFLLLRARAVVQSIAARRRRYA